MKISVITPSYNSGKYIERAIKSVQEQNYLDFEHIIVDGGSTDNTVNLLKSYGNKIKWISEKDSGQAEAMNKGFKMSTGDIIVYLNADDYFFPKAFESVIKEFEGGAKFVAGNILVKSSRLNKKYLNVPRIDLKGMLFHWEKNAFCYNPVGYFYLREVQGQCPFNPKNHFTMDLEFLLEASSKFKFSKINLTLGCFEENSETKTSRTQSDIDYWQIDTFSYVNKYLSVFSASERINFLNARCRNYVKMQTYFNSLVSNHPSQIFLDDRQLISVIVPTYNCGAYLKRAIDSILMQDYKNIEIIIVDDFSTDNTKEILNNYTNNPLITIIYEQENKKPGAARNKGMSLAKGKYIFFLDADDWIDQKTLISLLSISEKYKAEIVSCGVDKIWSNNKSKLYHSSSFTCNGGVEALRYFANHQITSVIWGKLYLSEFIKRNNLQFVSPYLHEDVMFTLEAINLCTKYISISNRFYKYFQRKSSIINSKPTTLHLKSYIKLHLDMTSFFDTNKLPSSEEGRELCSSLLKAHCSDDIFPRLIKYIETRTQKEWEKECNDVCYEMFGPKGDALASFIINSMKKNTHHMFFGINWRHLFRKYILKQRLY